MKLFFLSLFCLLLAAPSLMAQTLDPAIQEAIKASLPQQYVGLALQIGTTIIVFIAAYGRFTTARKNGLSVPAALLTIFTGTNTPTASLVIACLCMLGLSSCAQWDAFVASPKGKATATLVDLGADVAVATGLLPLGSNVLIQEGVAIVTDPSKPGVQKTVALEKLGLDKAVDAKLVTPGDSLLIQQDTAIIQKAITPLLPSAKQPVNVTPAKAPVATPVTLNDVPACLRIKDRTPPYGTQVAFMLSTTANP